MDKLLIVTIALCVFFGILALILIILASVGVFDKSSLPITTPPEPTTNLTIIPPVDPFSECKDVSNITTTASMNIGASPNAGYIVRGNSDISKIAFTITGNIENPTLIEERYNIAYEIREWSMTDEAYITSETSFGIDIGKDMYNSLCWDMSDQLFVSGMLKASEGDPSNFTTNTNYVFIGLKNPDDKYFNDGYRIVPHTSNVAFYTVIIDKYKKTPTFYTVESFRENFDIRYAIYHYKLLTNGEWSISIIYEAVIGEAIVANLSITEKSMVVQIFEDEGSVPLGTSYFNEFTRDTVSTGWDTNPTKVGNVIYQTTPFEPTQGISGLLLTPDANTMFVSFYLSGDNKEGAVGVYTRSAQLDQFVLLSLISQKDFDENVNLSKFGMILTLYSNSLLYITANNSPGQKRKIYICNVTDPNNIELTYTINGNDGADNYDIFGTAAVPYAILLESYRSVVGSIGIDSNGSLIFDIFGKEPASLMQQQGNIQDSVRAVSATSQLYILSGECEGK
jgi:hypothetical protein